jgi:hypothetical protein
MLDNDAKPLIPLQRRTSPPACHKCPKITEKDALADPRVLEVIFLYRLGIRETDDIIRSDSWKYAAFRIVRDFEELRDAEAMKKQMAQPKKGR